MPFAYQPDANTPHTTDQDGALKLIAAAQEEGVQQFIYTSFTMDLDFPLRTAKHAAEASLAASGMTFTILQPTYFTEVWLSPAVGFDFANRKASLYGAGQNPISWISYLDVAQFVAASVDNQAAKNATLALGGAAGDQPAGSGEDLRKGRRQTLRSYARAGRGAARATGRRDRPDAGIVCRVDA